MQFRYGATRFVLLIGDRAVKIWRPRPLWLFVRAYQTLVEGRFNEKLMRHHDHPLMAVVMLIFAGIVANRMDHHCYRRFKDARLAPVTSIWFWGIVIVQERGEPVTRVNLNVVSHPLWEIMVEEYGGVPRRALCQFARFGHRILLVDSGWPPVQTRLNEIYQ